jgi:hypothetical protein
LAEFGRSRVCTRGGKAIDRGGIGAIEQIEELEVGMESNSFSEIEPLGNAHIGVDDRRRNEVIAPLHEIYPIEMAVAINVRGFCRKRSAIVESALRSENTAKVHFPWKLYEAVHQ